MSQDEKHPGKVGQQQTVINTALSQVLEGKPEIAAVSHSDFGLEEGRGCEKAAPSFFASLYIFGGNTLFTSSQCSGHTMCHIYKDFSLISTLLLLQGQESSSSGDE